MKLLSVYTSLFVIVCSGVLAIGQTPTPSSMPSPLAAYDIISIHPIKNPAGGMSWQALGNGGFRSEGLTITGIIMQAYKVLNVQILNKAGWVDSAQYEIIAKMDEQRGEKEEFNRPVSEQNNEQKLYRERLQSLLADRFGLRVHFETKEMPVYVLIASKDGPKLERSTSAGSSSTEGRGQLDMSGTSMADFAMQLTSVLGSMVIDKTGDSGKFDVDLKWTPDEYQGSDLTGPSIFTAVKEQLGLKLESQKAPVEVLVIDHIEKPSPN